MEKKVIPLFGEGIQEDKHVLEDEEVFADDELDEELDDETVEALQELAEDIRAFAREIKQHPAYDHREKINQAYTAAACATAYAESYVDALMDVMFQNFVYYEGIFTGFDQRLAAIEKKLGLRK